MLYVFTSLTSHHFQSVRLGLSSEFYQGPAFIVAGGEGRIEVFLLVGEGFVVFPFDLDCPSWW